MPQSLHLQHTDTWHAQQDALEQDWLHAWMNGLIEPNTLQPHTVGRPPVPVLTLGGTR